MREKNSVRQNVRVVVPDQDVTDDTGGIPFVSFSNRVQFFRCKKVDLEIPLVQFLRCKIVDLEPIPFVQQGEQLIGANKGGKWLVLLLS